MTRFPTHDIISLVGEAARYELGESTGPDLRLAALLEAAGQDGLGDMPLGYATAAGDPQLRRAIAEAHGVHADDVVVTMGGMHALFLSAFILCNRGDEAVTTSPLFPLARHALDMVGAQVHTLPLSFERGYQLDVAALRGQLSPATKLVSLASPQNPSGVASPQPRSAMSWRRLQSSVRMPICWWTRRIVKRSMGTIPPPPVPRR
jgi:aspartate/methionine/tyrosine aminotransferase